MVRIAGVVLAGGRSRRMGRDKSLLRLGGDTAPTLLERSVALLRPLCEQVWVSCRAGQTYARQNCVPDLLPASGPICGVHAALVRARAEGIPAVLALSCDLPLMHTGMLRRLVAAFAASPRQSLMTAFMSQWLDGIPGRHLPGGGRPFSGSCCGPRASQDAGSRAPRTAMLRKVRGGRRPCFFQCQYTAGSAAGSNRPGGDHSAGDG